jgi:hypothetical protein
MVWQLRRNSALTALKKKEVARSFLHLRLLGQQSEQI